MDNSPDLAVSPIDLDNKEEIKQTTALRRLTYVAAYGDDDKFYPDAADKEMAYRTFLQEQRENWPKFGEKLVKNGEIIGTVEYRAGDDFGSHSYIGYMQGLAVKPAYRRMGYGRYLCDRAIQWFAEQGVDKAWLRTTEMNEGALAFYYKTDWSIIASEIGSGDGEIKILQRMVE